MDNHGGISVLFAFFGRNSTAWRGMPKEERRFTTEDTESTERERLAKEKAAEEDRCREMRQGSMREFRNGTVDHVRGEKQLKVKG